jgi:hypothetical protein
MQNGAKISYQFSGDVRPDKNVACLMNFTNNLGPENKSGQKITRLVENE